MYDYIISATNMYSDKSSLLSIPSPKAMIDRVSEAEAFWLVCLQASVSY